MTCYGSMFPVVAASVTDVDAAQADIREFAREQLTLRGLQPTGDIEVASRGPITEDDWPFETPWSPGVELWIWKAEAAPVGE